MQTIKYFGKKYELSLSELLEIVSLLTVCDFKNRILEDKRNELLIKLKSL